MDSTRSTLLSVPSFSASAVVPEKFHHLNLRFPFPKRSFGSKVETRSFRAEWCEKHSRDASTDAAFLLIMHDDRSREEIQGKYQT